MDNKFSSQQEALRTAFNLVLGSTPTKGQLVITPEQRQKVGEVMMQWLKEERWSIKPGTRAAENPLNYIVGTQPTCLIQAWVQPRKPKESPSPSSAPQQQNQMEAIKQALAAGLISQEQAQAAALKLLGL